MQRAKDMTPKKREELLRELKARFEKNVNRHEGLEWTKVQAKLEVHTENCGHSMKWKELAVNRMLLVMINRRANTFFMIVQRKVLKGAQRLVMTVKGRRKGKSKGCIREVTLLIWQLPWVLSH